MRRHFMAVLLLQICQRCGTAMAWRASVGVGLMWASPFGRCVWHYAFPVLKQDGDRVQNFSFGVSTRF